MRSVLFALIAVAQLFALSAISIAGDIHDVCQPHAICAGNPKLVGGCFTFRGVFRLYNGNPTFRIIRTGTRRVLGVLCDQDPIIPASLAAWINDPTNAQWDRDFRGGYEVCPFTKSKPGVMQFVCVEKVSNLTVYDHNQRRIVHSMPPSAK
jgi:hypothetical protein